jgi:hypothetical protein
MLAQKIYRRDAEAQRENKRYCRAFLPFTSSPFPIFFLSLCLCVSAVNLSCTTTKPTDMRSLAPADALIYFETNDLAAALQPIIDSKPFNEVAKSKPDFSALKGVQLAVAITGFETSEEKVDDEQVIGRIEPHFVAIADTHAWNFQAVGFAEQKLGSFVEKLNDSQPTLEKSDKHGGKYFTWTDDDGSKALALVIGSVIYFANDESSIEKCLAVRRSESDNITKTGNVQPAEPTTLASGYVSPDGIAQISNIVGVQFAAESSNEPEVQSAVAGILPQLIRNSITEVNWTATRMEQGIEDKYLISMPPDMAKVLNDAFAAGNDSTANSLNNVLAAQLPAITESATRYNLKDPQLALRSVLQIAEKQLDSFAGKALSEFAALWFEPYGIDDPELFLSSLGGESQANRNIITARLDSENDEVVVVAARGADQATIKSLSSDLRPVKEYKEHGLIFWSLWSTEADDIQVIFDGDLIKLGSKEDLSKVNGVTTFDLSDIRTDDLRKLASSNSPIVTFVRDHESARQVADVILATPSEGTKPVSTYFTETRFTKSGIERRTVSDFGLIGSIIAQLGQD